jgi:DNA-binding MarR family transcriptional regulator
MDKDRADSFLKLLRMIRGLGSGQPPFEECGVSSAQLSLLEWFAEKPLYSLQDAADGLGVSAPNVSVAVRRLESVGLVSRLQDPSDGRAWQFELTRAGTELLGHVDRYRREKAALVLGALSPEEQLTLISLLGKALGSTNNSIRASSPEHEKRVLVANPKKLHKEKLP